MSEPITCPGCNIEMEPLANDIDYILCLGCEIGGPRDAWLKAHTRTPDKEALKAAWDVALASALTNPPVLDESFEEWFRETYEPQKPE